MLRAILTQNIKRMLSERRRECGGEYLEVNDRGGARLDEGTAIAGWGSDRATSITQIHGGGQGVIKTVQQHR